METEFLYGPNTAEELLNAGRRRVLRLVVARGASGKAAAVAELARRKGVRVEFSDPRVLEKLSRGGNHQGVVAEAEPLKAMGLEEALALEKGRRFLWAGIDGVTDPMNLGAIIRSAACFGVSAVVLPERRTAGVTPVVQKTASGALERLNIVEVVNLNQTILSLKERNVWVYGADMKGEGVDKADPAFPAFLIIGSEGYGLHAKTAEHCDKLLSIPQKGGVESLNASAAAAVLFYELSKKL